VALDEEPGDREDEEQLAELGRLELDRADVDPALRASDRLREGEDDHHQAQGDAVDDTPVAAVDVGRDRDRGYQPEHSHDGSDRLAHHEVVLVARHVEARDARDRPEPVADERRHGEQQHEVEAPHEAGQVDAVSRARAERLTPGLDDHQSVLTRVWLLALTPKNLSNTRSAAGAAAVEPWPPFSITAHTTMRATSVCAGP
jgi:hypothetical protein